MPLARSLRSATIVSTVAALVVVGAPTASAAPITLVPNTQNMFRDNRGVNNVGVGAGDVVQYGADIQGGSQGTSVSALHTSGFVDPVAPCGPLAVNANFCAGAFVFQPANLNGWTIRFTNGPDTTNIAAPSLTGAETKVPFPASVTISAGATATSPTIRWVVPNGFAPDAFRVNIFDVDGPTLANGSKNVIHSVAIAKDSLSYTIPTGVLQLGHNYSINLQLIDLRPGVTEAQFVAANSNAMILNRSNSYFNFQPIVGGPPNVHLPTVGPDTTPGDNRGAPYQFNITQVGRASVTFIDPLVAIGYEYAIGAGDPNFASVLLPDVGDGLYDVIFDGAHHAVTAGDQFFFPTEGVSLFTVLGIETSAGLDPLNVNAFITGLTFVADGQFTGTMTPLTELVPDSAVPEPLSLVLVSLGLGAIAAVRRRSQ